uniref:Knottin scorpion toxin-like domain-containing protein n=1 Tax=Aegilops tauschii subsp. strangulata TaxID=200361 RepID=A0A453RCE3_AEGTS
PTDKAMLTIPFFLKKKEKGKAILAIYIRILERGGATKQSIGMAIGVWWTTKKSLLLKLSVYLLIIAMANCSRDIPDSVSDHPPGYIICGEITATWGKHLCIKHGTCNKPCRAEGYDSGYCAPFPWSTYCCCKNNCGESVQPHRSSFICEGKNNRS